MSLYKELSYDNDFEPIKGIQFCIMSPEEIQKRSVVEIKTTNTYNGNDPELHGLFDPRMGVIDHNKVCVTCKQRNTFCPGHFGHINLARPVFYVQFFGMVRNLLKCVCFRCSKLLVDPDSPEIKALMAKKYSRQKRWETIYKQRVKRCGMYNIDGCGAKQPTIAKEGMLKISMEWKETGNNNGEDNSKKLVLSADDVLKILRRISDRDAEILGFSPKYNRPEYMICTVLPVPPPAVRPSVRNDTGQRSEDDLTHKLSMIIKTNNQLKQKIDKMQKDQIDMVTMVLQYDVATLIDNTINGIPPSQQRTGRPIRSLTERLKSKEGRIRGNLMGKRVDFSARSVITPDPNISIDELGVPVKIAMNLTFPEIVNKYNMEKMKEYVLKGPDAYPGAKYVRKTKENRTIRLRNVDRSKVADLLEAGDVVERHMIDGDCVLFNRQPSLHRLSMLCHRVRVMPYNTFRLNVMVTPCFNADFDGDEMNMHLPQSLQTHEELLQLAAVPTQIISPRECKPIVSVVQDIALGIYRLTKEQVRISEKQFFNLLTTNPMFAGFVAAAGFNENGVPKWSGRQLLSSIIPKKINVEMRTGQYDEKKTAHENRNAIVSIKNGEIHSGTFDKDVYQARTKGLVHSIYNEYGPEETRKFFDNTQKLICNWLVLNGFSVGISDLIVDDKTMVEFDQIIKDMKIKVYDIIRDIHTGKHHNKSTKNNNDYFEKVVNDLLNQANRSVGEKGLSQIDENKNRLINMIKAKSKGNTINVAQMIGCLGQQNVDGARIPYGFEDRTLPHYTKYDDGPESRGFVENSFIKGLTPQEFFFHAMGGREGLIDTACQTSTIGYVQRKLVKAMEDCKVNHDLSVRNASGSIIQFLYGEDGMDASKIESQGIPYTDMDINKMMREYKFSDTLDELKVLMDPEVFKRVQKDKTWRKSCDEHFAKVLDDKDFLIHKVFRGKFETSVMYPVSLQRIINNTKGLYANHGCNVFIDLEPAYVLNAIDKLVDELYVSKQHKGNRLFQILVRAYLSPKVVIVKHRLIKEAFDYIVHQVRCRFFESFAHPSEMVGVVAAQSLGEPATQLSVVRSTQVKILNNNMDYNGDIGSFVDGLLEKHSARVIHLGNDSVVLDLEGDSDHHFVVGVSDCEKTSWRRISQVSRHPAHGGLVKVTTATGKTTTCTLSHSFLKRSAQQKVVPVKGSDLKLGDRIPVARFVPTIENKVNTCVIGKNIEELDAELGWLAGAYLSNGWCSNDGQQVTITKTSMDFSNRLTNIVYCRFGCEVSTRINNFNSLNHTLANGALHDFLAANFGPSFTNKRLPGWVYASNMSFIKGLVQGFFDGEGHVCDMPRKQTISVTSASGYLVDDIIVLMAYLGIFATKTTDKRHHTLTLSRKQARLFRDKVGFSVATKARALDNVVVAATATSAAAAYNDDYVDKIPEVAHLIAAVGKKLKLQKHAREYEKWTGTENVSRSTIAGYVTIFENACAQTTDLDPEVPAMIAMLRQAMDADVLWDEIVALDYLDDPKDYVYDFTVPGNDSFMVDCGVLVHNTLNSVVHETPLLLDIDGSLEKATIGEFVDKHFETVDPSLVESHPNDTWLAYIKDHDVKILSCTKEGQIVWSKVEAVTKHPVVNQDGSNTLIKVTLQSGREVTATKGKSFLQRINNEIVAVEGKDIRVGDYIPISRVLPITSEVDSIDGFDLDPSFGFFVGTYLNNGSIAADMRRVVIKSTADPFRVLLLTKMCAKHDIGYTCTTAPNNMQFELTSPKLASLVLNNFGKYPKTMPAKLLAGSTDFLKALVEGFFIGKCNMCEHAMNVHIVSFKELLNSIQQVLVRFDIHGNIGMTHQGNHILTIAHGNAVRFATTFDVQMPSKQTKLANASATFMYGAYDVIPSVVLSGTEVTVHRDDIDKIKAALSDEGDVKVLSGIEQETILYDKIVRIEEVPNPHPYVYDLTVENTRTFNTFDGVTQYDTFHMSGVSSASATVRGVPRLEELLRVSKNIKTAVMKIYFKEDFKFDLQKCKDITNEIRTIRFRDIVTVSRIYFDPDDFNTNIAADREFLNLYKDFLDQDDTSNPKLSPWLLRMEFNTKMLSFYNLDMIHIHQRLIDFYGEDNINCMFSDDNASQLIFRVRLVMNNDEVDDMLTEIKALEYNILENIIIKGVKNIERVSLDKEQQQVYNSATKEFEKKDEWIAYTDGSNLRDVLRIANIDSTNTITNDVVEIYEVLGIEAARQALFNEINEVLESVYVNYRHISLLVDVQTNKGYIMSIDRHGINRGDIGPLAKCSFEETTDKLIKAGIFAEYDKINGVSANIMLGQIAPCGTGDVEVLIDESMVAARDNADDSDADAMDDMDMDEFMLDAVCDTDVVKIEFNVPSLSDSFAPERVPNRLVVAK